MKTINKTFTCADDESIIIKVYKFKDDEALNQATFYTYNPKIVDETLLDENGNVPLVEAVNEDGTPKYEQEYDMETLEATGNKLDEDGKPIRAMEPLDVYIDNPTKPVDFLSGNFDKFIKPWFMAPAQAEAKRHQKNAEREAAAATKTMLDAIEGGVESKIETVIE
jgi:hypothetical protein